MVEDCGTVRPLFPDAGVPAWREGSNNVAIITNLLLRPSHMKLNLPVRSLIALTILTLLCTVAPLRAQLGTGWTVKTVTERLQYETNDILFSITPAPSSFSNNFCAYSKSGNTRTFQLLTHSSNRIEIRDNDDYSTGTRQFQADIVMTPPTSGESIHQIFNGPTGPWCIIRQYTNFNGSIRIFAGSSTSYVATNLNGHSFRLNTINDMNSGQCYFYVNGRLVHQVANPGGTFYTKYGAYGTHDNAHPAYIVFTNATLFTGGDETGAGNGNFSLSASPNSVSVVQGNSVTSTITETDLNGYAGTVKLSASGLPGGVTASFSPNPTTGSSTLTLTASSTAAIGTAAVTITGTDNTIVGDTLIHSTTISLTVNSAADFSVSAAPSSQTVTSGGIASGTATVTPSGGFSGTVNWSASGVPAGATMTFNPTSVTGSGTSTWSMTLPSNLAPGTYPITITGTSGSLSHSTTVTIIVSDFSISASPSSQTVTAGNSASYTVTLGSANGFANPVNLSISGLPAGATATFNPASVTPVGSSTLTVNTGAGTPAGTYTLTITGASGSASHSATVTLVVNAPPDYSIIPVPASVTITQGSSGTTTISVNGMNGYSGTVSFSASGLPAGVTASFSPASTTSSSTLTFTASSTATTGTSPVTVTGTDGTLTRTTTVSLTVNPSSGGALPTGWTDVDIGAVGLAGSASYNAGTFTVSGSGADIWTAADQFNYAYQSISGDYTIIARVITEDQTAGYAKAGVMIRSSLATNAVEASVLLTPTNGVAMEVRPAVGATTINVAGWIKPTLPPQWVKLVRTGNTFTASYSADGSSWTPIASTNVTMASSVTAGLAVTAHNNAALNTATFDNVSVSANTVVLDPTAIYQIQNVASGLVLNNQGSLTNGSKVTQWSAASTSVNLQWKFIATTNGYYQINSVRSGLDAVVQGASTASGAGIVQWSFGSTGNDQWKPVLNGDGSYTFVNLHSGLVLDDPGSSTSTSTQMDQETSNGGSNQKWNLLKQ